jgi:tRNA modification GTPase
MPPLPAIIADKLSPETTLVVLNKTDLLHGKPALAQPPAGLPTLAISALKQTGLSALETRIGEFADLLRPAHTGDQIAINARHADALRRAQDCLVTARQNIAQSGPTELLASDLRGVLEAYGDIGGRIDNEAMLDRLFSTFCIGK